MVENPEEFELVMMGKMMKRLRDCLFSSLRSRYDFKQVEIEVIICLYACPEQSAAEIAKKLFLQKGHVSLALERLRDKNLITCQRDADDHRQINISLSEKGLELYREILNNRQIFNEIMFRGFSDEEMSVLNALSKRIVNNVCAELEHVGSSRCFQEER